MNRKTLDQDKGKIIVMGDLDRLKVKHNQGKGEIRIQNLLCKEIRQKHKRGFINPVKVYSQGNALASIDQNDQAWLICEPFENPVNVSSLIRKKITKLVLGEKQMILQTKKQFYLLNWGSKKLIDSSRLTKINTYSSTNDDNLFEAFLINTIKTDDIYFYTPQKKNDNSNRLYFIDNNNGIVNGYPTNSQIKFNIKIKGLSVGKFHCLCWDYQGNIYSWGCRSLGLGYRNLPSEEIIQTPRIIDTAKNILCAFAGCHYSLALSSEGIIYEWGIKKQVNQINEQSIFQPRHLKFKYYNCNARFVALKGRQNNYAALSSTGQLYIWGLNARGMLNSKMNLPSAWKGNYIYEPVLLTDLIDHKILDFSVEMNFIAVSIGNEGAECQQEQDYWLLLKERAKKQLCQLKMIRVNTESDEVQKLKKKYKNAILSDCRNKTERNDKSSQKIEQLILKKKQQNIVCVQLQRMNPLKKTAPAISNPHWSSSLNLHKRQISDGLSLTKNIRSSQQQKIWRASQMSTTDVGFQFMRRNFSKRQKKFTQSYTLKLQQILQKKRKIEEFARTTNIKKIDESTIQFKLRRKQELLFKKKKDQEEAIVKQTLYSFMVKSYIVNLFMKPLEEGRQLKIGNFARSLVLQRVQRNIKKLFVGSRIKFALQKLQNTKITRFFLLIIYFKNYVSKFRSRKRESSRRLIVQQMTKRTLFDKIKVGIIRLQPQVSKLHKLKEWMVLIHKQRKKCLKELWNNFIMIIFRMKHSGDSTINNANQDICFANLYSQKLQENRMLELNEFLRCSRKKSRTTSTKDESRSMTGTRRRAHIKFQDQIKQRTGIMSQILPFSSHYNFFRRPKQLDIIISQNMHSSSGWIDIERRLLDESLNQIIRNHNKYFVFSMRQYEIDLANFIKVKYDTFYEKRWKYIIEYNKVQKTYSKAKRQAQLKRILGIIGMTKLLDEDCIPQKYLILDEAIKRKDSPQHPDPLIQFDYNKFEQVFHLYWQTLNSKAKQVKKRIL